MLWEEELEAKRIQDDEDRKRKVHRCFHTFLLLPPTAYDAGRYEYVYMVNWWQLPQGVLLYQYCISAFVCWKTFLMARLSSHRRA